MLKNDFNCFFISFNSQKPLKSGAHLEKGGLHYVFSRQSGLGNIQNVMTLSVNQI